jgi:hypothetical protein
MAVISPKGSSSFASPAVAMRFEYRALQPLESLEFAIGAAKPDLIVPGDDTAVGHLHELYAKAVGDGPSGRFIKELIERSLGEPENFVNVRSRPKLLSLAREEGIPVPASMEIRNASDLETWGAKQAFPWVLKMDGNCGGLGVRMVSTMAQAKRARQVLAGHPSFIYMAKRLIVNRDPFPARPWLRRASPTVSVQAFIRGIPANISVAAWKGEVIGAFSVVVSETLMKNGPASVVQLVDNPTMRLAAERIARRLKITGFFGLDFMIEDGTKNAYLIELNPRVTQLCHLPLGPGRDLTNAIYEKLSGTLTEGVPLRLSGDRIVIFPNAWQQNLADEVLASGYHDVPWDDPGLVDEMLKPIWCNRGPLHSAVDWIRTLRNDGSRGPTVYHRRELRRPTTPGLLPAMDSAKTDVSI